MFTAILMLAARIAQGRLTEIVDAVRSFAAEYTDFPIWRAGLAFVLAQIGEIAEASEVIEGLLASGDPFSKDYMWLLGHWYLGSALSIAGARDAAEQAYRELLPFSSRLAANNTITLGTISSLLGSLAVRLGRGEDAHRHFEDALEIENRIGAVMWRPRTQLAWGELLAAEGSAPRAAELLRSAQTEAAELGIADVERRAAAGLAELAKMA
jgi:tetratricopeptide (TPR) repeat protein